MMGWHTWDIRPENCDKKNKCQTGFSTVFAKNSPAKKSCAPKNSALVKSDLANTTKQWVNEYYKWVCRKRASTLRNSVGNEQRQTCFGKFKNLRSFIDEKNWPKTNWQEFWQHADQLNGARSIHLKAIAFSSWL